MRYYQSATVGLRLVQTPLQQSICFMFGRFDSLNFSGTLRSIGTLVAARLLLQVYVCLRSLITFSFTMKWHG